MKNTLLLFAVLLFALAPAMRADWDPTEPAKWVQMPDESDYGIDVNATDPFILADDFQCTETGPVTEVHIWGSWFNDYLPFGVPDSCMFILSFHVDIPDSLSPTGYSMPGDVVMYRTFEPGEYTARPWLQGPVEGWLDPPDGYIYPADQVIWQYNFPFAGTQFGQEGTPDDPKVYWLDVQAFPYDPEARFGWKTSIHHWNDDAVWGQGTEPYMGPWEELRYPPGHEFFGQSIDLAFVLVGGEAIDWGDAPEIIGGPGYPTTAANSGANHVIGGPWLGDNTDTPDAELDGQPEPTAMGDDNDGNDDEDGVVIPPLTPGGAATVTFEVNDGGTGVNPYVEGWIDFNANMIWEAGEHIVSGACPPGPNAVTFTVPAAAVPGQTFSRWRISTVAGLTPTGGAPDGEVEDHEVVIEEEPAKWLQPPDLDRTGMDVHATEPIILADDFLCTEPGRIVDILIWGSWLDDYIPFNEDAGAVDFTLSFHRDIPESLSSTGYSMPGDPEWWMDFPAGTFDHGVYADSLQEGWYYPPDDAYTWPGDFTCWYYHFHISPDEAFFQSGSAAGPMVYWLDVQARPHDADAVFGWKTSLRHWNDDAVWGDGTEPYPGPWFELRYPPGHEMAGESIDLAFRLINDPASGVPSRPETPADIGLFQNMPNPFAGSTTIKYALPAAGHVKLEVFDVTGRLVSVLVDGPQAAGFQAVVWEGRDARGNEMPSGVYFYRLSLEDETRTMKMLLLR